MPSHPCVDLTGKQFGLQMIESYSGHGGIWIARCVNCGLVSKKSRNNLLRYGEKSGCKNCSGLSKGSSGLNRIFVQYTGQAKRLSREFSLTIDEFKNLTSSCCHYCGKCPLQLSGSNLKQKWKKSTWSDYYFNGIDRKDNSKGYTISNSLSCCWDCNHMKGKKKYDEFIHFLDKLVKFRMPKLTAGKIQLLCGMIGSGKSSYAKNAAAEGALIYNDDALVNMFHADQYELYDEGLKVLYKSTEHHILGSVMAMQRTMIIDRGLNVSAKARQRWVCLAQSLDVPCEAIVFENYGPEVHAQRRVAHDSRGHSFDYWLKVAEQHNANYSEPTLEEGFDQIHHISFDEIKRRRVF